MPFYDPSNTAERAYGTVRVAGEVDFGTAPQTVAADMTAALVGLPGWYTIFESAGGFRRGGSIVAPNTSVSSYLLVTVPPGFSILSGPSVDSTGLKIKIQIG
jgi:hypothetical protein